MQLGIANHDRGRLGKTYIYPVLSRRARGLSVGINLNPNQACNWRCIYCQVPGLVAGNAPQTDLALLDTGRARRRAARRAFLEPRALRAGLDTHAPEGARELRDLALSGDGESTSA